jgi:hypothetical protein
MSSLIPLLSQVAETATLLPVDFVDAFVALHGHDWDRAQSHWERIVERVLDTDAVEAHATGGKAMRQAVRATVILLARSDLRGRCPMCTRPTFGLVPAARGGSDA